MPHFIIDCSENILKLQPPDEVMQTVHDLADSTGLFAKGDIKVRINPYHYFNVANTSNDFIHVFAYIMEGRNTQKKANLSRIIVTRLKELFPDVPVISMNIKDFERASYCNRTMV